MMWSRHLLIVAASLVLLSACAEERAPINRVQPNVIRKADLAGEWYYQQTVIDMDTSANYSVIGDNAFWNLERIRWDIQENYLYARRSFEWVDNSDSTDFNLQISNGRAVGATVEMNGEPYLGSIVAAYRIESQFDIRREYNPTTGEEVNVIVENSSDRPWNEREYMRVDWSMNLATDYDFDYFFYEMGELQIDPVPYYVQEDGPPEFQPTWDYDENEQLWYFDFVQQLSVHPGSTYEPYYDAELPTCWFFSSAGVDCATTTLTVRASFLRTDDEEQDFEPMEFKGDITSVFGFWTVDRLRYSHRAGLREYDRRRYAQIHNIWERSHNGEWCQTDDQCPEADSRCDTNINYQPSVCTLPWNEYHFDQACETDADCTLPGSRCDTTAWDPSQTPQCTIPDVAHYSSQICEQDSECPAGTICLSYGECTIPFRDRTPKPIVFYATGGWPEDLDTAGMWDRIEYEYDWTFRRAVAAAQLNSEIINGAANDDAGAIAEARARLDNIEAACETDADCQAIWGDWGTGDSVCQTEGDGAQPHRYAGHCTTPVRQMYYICHAPVREDDPAECGPAGRIVHMGDIRYNVLQYSREWNPLSPLGQSPTAPDPLSGRVFGSTVSLYDAVDTVATRIWEFGSLINGQLDPSEYISGEDLTHWIAQQTEEREAREERTYTRDDLRQMYRARNTEWMNVLRQPASEGRPQGYGSEVLPNLLANLQRTGAFMNDRDFGRGFYNSLHESPIEDLLLNDEMLMGANYAPGTPITPEVRDAASPLSPEYSAWRTIRREWLARHNWNRNITYADLYWVPYEQVADEIAAMTPEEAFQYLRLRIWEGVIIHELGHNMGLYHNFAGSEDMINYAPEWWAARTENFTRNPRNRLEDPVDDAEIDAGLEEYAYSSVMDYDANYAGGEHLGRYDRAAILFGYGRSVEAYREIEGGIGPADLAEYYSSSGSYLRFLDAGMYSLHYTEFYNRWGRDMFDASNRRILPMGGLQDDLMTVVDPTDPDGRSFTRVPYLYCNDYHADLGENCHRWDFGVDTYERMQDIIQRESLYYLAYNFRRGRVNDDSQGFIEYIYERQYSRYKMMHDYYNLIDALCHMYYSEESCEDFFTDPREGWGTYTAAINDGFNSLMQSISRPDVAYFNTRTRGDGTDVFADTGFYDPATSPRLALGDGRYFTTAWWDDSGDDDCGEEWWECLHHHGFYLNKLFALMTLAEAETFFVARDTAEDIRMWRISYFDDYSDQILDLLGGVLSEDYADFAPYITPRADGAEYSDIYLRNYADPTMDPVFLRQVPEDAMAVDPYTGFTYQLYSAVIGFSMLHTNYNNAFITSARMCVCGGDHCVEPGDGADPDMPVLRYEDPISGMAYCTVNREDGAGIAQRMLQHANTLKSRTEYCDRTDPEAPDACVSGLSPDQRAAAQREMTLYTDQLDVLIHLTARYDNWMFSYGDPFNPGDVPEDW